MFRHYSVIFDSVKAPFADTRVLNEPKNVRKVFSLFANIRHCSRSSDCLSKQRERVVYANCTVSLYQTVSSPSSLLHAKQFRLDIYYTIFVISYYHGSVHAVASSSIPLPWPHYKDDIIISLERRSPRGPMPAHCPSGSSSYHFASNPIPRPSGR